MASKTKVLPRVEKREGADREKALAKALEMIDKQFGKGTIMRMSDDAAQKDIEAIPTGSLSLDLALGIGGLPKGRIIEIFGPESSGKTTLALHVIAEMQKAGGTCAFVDAEHALDTQYAAKLGVDVSSMLLSQPDCGEQALEITDALVRSGAVDLIVVDSVAALTPRGEIEGLMGEALPGLQARLMSQALRKITGSVTKTQSMVIFINQIRYKIGGYGNPETTAGGNALKFYSSVRLDIRRGKPIKVNDEIVGNETRVKVVKNKIAPPFKLAAFDILYGEGISHFGELIDMAEELGVVDKSGAWYSYNGKKLGQGKEKVRDLLKEDAELADEIEQKIRSLKGIHMKSCLTPDEEYEEEQAQIAAAQARRMAPPAPQGAPAGAPMPDVRLRDIPINDDEEAALTSAQAVAEELGF